MMMKVEDINNLPTYQKMIALGLIIVSVIAVFFIVSYLPKKEVIKGLEGEISKIENEINVNKPGLKDNAIFFNSRTRHLYVFNIDDSL